MNWFGGTSSATVSRLHPNERCMACGHGVGGNSINNDDPSNNNNTSSNWVSSPNASKHTHHHHPRAASAEPHLRREKHPGLIPPENGVPRAAGGSQSETELPALPWPPANGNGGGGNFLSSSLGSASSSSAGGLGFGNHNSAGSGNGSGVSRASKRITMRETNREAIYGPSSSHHPAALQHSSSSLGFDDQRSSNGYKGLYSAGGGSDVAVGCLNEYIHNFFLFFKNEGLIVFHVLFSWNPPKERFCE